MPAEPWRIPMALVSVELESGAYYRVFTVKPHFKRRTLGKRLLPTPEIVLIRQTFALEELVLNSNE